MTLKKAQNTPIRKSEISLWYGLCNSSPRLPHIKKGREIMKKFFIALLFTLPFFFVAPKNYAQLNVNVNIGNPAVRPYPDAVWVQGYYYYDPVLVRRVWVPGKW